ncbi:MAG: dethiobiotin synthase [Rhodospirillaceae bacterium]|nr:dethiobiotin synthase [Rhodospirillaceae bacterium]|tara:strand:+ start:2857 stop:3537 length:681 start_codon:yes stop_codon:yes gene_type:complete
MSNFFITGTGTEVGKTLISAAICHQLTMAGKVVQPLKPVLSGFEENNVDSSDSGILLSSIGSKITKENFLKVTPWCFKAPLSPDMAAERENRSINFNKLIQFTLNKSDSADILIVEGVGGAMVPLDSKHTVMDWISNVDMPAILVAGSYLGTISHTLTTLEAMKSYGISIKGLIISESPESPVSLEELVITIRRYVSNLPIFVVPRLPDIPKNWEKAPDLISFLNL